ncbi:MAG: hypothetical protein GY749_08535, partial [Desulfobacteraceae bacterium]|nr:hypothetical protein [Desulfobacteraceae bacterium]
MGPLVSIDDIYENSEANLVVKGYAFDDSGISGFVINGRDFPIDGSPTELEIHEFVRIQQDKKELTIAVRDIAGNVTDVKTGINRTMQAVLTADASSSASDLRGFGNPAGLRISGTGNMSDCMTSPKSGLIKICINKKTEERTEQITYLNSAVIDGYIDSDELVELHIRRKTRKKKPENGDKKYELYEIYRKKFPRKQYHFTCVTELDEGENIINIRANQLSSGHSDAVAITIRRKKPDVEKYEARLNMFVAVFETKKTEDIRTMLITGFELLFADDLINHAPRRFHSVKNIKLGGDDEIVIKQANEKKFDCIVSGSIQERKNTVGERSVIINASIKDTESEQPVVKTVDVYAEDVSEDNVYDILKFLSHCLKLKLIDELPVVKGKVENKNKKVITVDIGKEKKVKKGMKLIVYNQENDSNSKELGEANIRSVEEKISHADLNEIKYSEVIRKGQSVITK